MAMYAMKRYPIIMPKLILVAFLALLSMASPVLAGNTPPPGVSGNFIINSGGFWGALNAVATWLGTGHNSINLKTLGLPTGGDDTTALNQATNPSASGTTNPTGLPVYAPCGTYRHSGIIFVNGLRFYGDGDCSILYSTNTTTGATNNAVELEGTAAKLDHMAVNSAWTGSRQGGLTSTGVTINGSANFDVSYVSIGTAASVGIFAINGASNGKIHDNYVANTLADGISLTLISNNIAVENNTTYNTGDDAFSNDSYQANGGQNYSNSFIGNTSVASKSRGFAMVGSANWTVTGNTVYNSTNAAFEAQSDAGFSTYGAANGIFSANNGYGASTCITIYGTSAFPTSHIIATGNFCSRVTSGANIGGAEDASAGTVDITLAHNKFVGIGTGTTSNYGVFFQGTNLTIDDNTADTFGGHCFSGGTTGGAGFLREDNNTAVNCGIAALGSQDAYNDFNTGFSPLYFRGNKQKNGTGTIGFLAVFKNTDTGVIYENNTGDNTSVQLPTTPSGLIYETKIGVGTTAVNAASAMTISGGALTMTATGSGSASGIQFPVSAIWPSGNDMNLSPNFNLNFFPTGSAGSFKPAFDNTSPLGAANARWNDLFVGTGSSSFAGLLGIGTTLPAYPLQVIGTSSATSYYAGSTAGVSCPANTVSLTTFVVTAGIVTHC